MDKKSKIFFLVFFLLIIGSVSFAYYRIMIKKDYQVSAQADCDPATEKCFVYVCDPAVEGECTGKPEEDTSYYKIVDKNASRINRCNTDDESCQPIVCVEGEKDCAVTLCDEQTVADAGGDTCNDPEEYVKNNPPVEETTCDPEAEDCSSPVDGGSGGSQAQDLTGGVEEAPVGANAD